MSVINRLRDRVCQMSWFTSLMLLLLLLALILIIVPGEFKSIGFQDKQITQWEKRCGELKQSTYDWHAEYNRKAELSNDILIAIFEHGWPKPFLARARVMKQTESGPNWVPSESMLGVKSWFTGWGGSTYLNVSWSSIDAWPIAADNAIFDFWSLVFDLLVGGCILVSVAALTQFWIASHHGRFRIHLRDLLGLVTIVALSLGVYLHHHRIRVTEGLATHPLQPPAFALNGNRMSASQDYCGPVWLRKLCGNAYYPQLFHHVTSIVIAQNAIGKDCFEDLPRYSYLETLYVQMPLPIGALESLKRCRSLKHLQLSTMSSGKNSLPHTPSDISAANLQLLRSLHLESIELKGDQIEGHHIKQVAAFPSIRFIKVTGVSASKEEIEAVRLAYPHVEIVVAFDFAVFFCPG